MAADTAPCTHYTLFQAAANRLIQVLAHSVLVHCTLQGGRHGVRLNHAPLCPRRTVLLCLSCFLCLRNCTIPDRFMNESVLKVWHIYG